MPRLVQLSITPQHLVQPVSQVILPSMSGHRQAVIPLVADANLHQVVVSLLEIRGWRTQLPADFQDEGRT